MINNTGRPSPRARRAALANLSRSMPSAHPDVAALIPHPYTDHEILNALTDTHRVDTTKLPASILEKAAARGDDTTHYGANREWRRKPTAYLWGVDLTENKYLWYYACAMVICASVAAVSLMYLLGISETTAMYVGAGAALGTLPVLVTAKRDERRAKRLNFTDDELEQLSAATVNWPRCARELSKYPAARTLKAEWQERTNSVRQTESGSTDSSAEVDLPRDGASALVWREPQLVAVSTLIAQDIKKTLAWKSPLFDGHRIRVDLDTTLDDIRLRAHRIWSIHANLVEVPSHTSGCAAIRDRNSQLLQAAELALDALVKLVVQLDDYRKQLAPIEAAITEIELLERSSEGITDAMVRQLHRDAAGAELQADAVAAAEEELQVLNAALTQQLTFLRQLLDSPANALAITQ
ncbi:hypothetical protein [Mycobacteroides abscessus]|uniref:hypothetical protein n=1 Tax=Mycobacteroides abscessus TaxID=36809 RepID=UPI0012FFFDD1|nr:hypothetical protein [Mycobacteroides abscessus]